MGQPRQAALDLGQGVPPLPSRRRRPAGPPAPGPAAGLAARGNRDPTAGTVSSYRPPPGPPFDIDPSIPNPARIYDALLGGKDHYSVDRKAAEAILDAAPQARQGARENRAFLQRAVRYLAREGIRQFLDIGTGLPTQGNVHQIARQVAPDARVVYVDHDPVVHAHANALLADQTTTLAVLADLRQPAVILDH